MNMQKKILLHHKFESAPKPMRKTESFKTIFFYPNLIPQ